MQPTPATVIPTMYEFAPDVPTVGLRPVHDFKPDTITQVAATGCACLLVHRSVFEVITEQRPEEEGLWFAEMTIGRTQYGEDVSFCLRCGLCGIPVHVHTGIQVGHIKTVTLGKVSP
jgi:hypothetical protein